MRIFKQLDYDFLGKRKMAYVLSGTLLLIGLISIAFRGLELGIDFKGGSEIALQFEKPVDIAEVRSYSDEIGLGKVEIKTFGGETGVLIRTELQKVPRDSYREFLGVIEKKIDELLPGVDKELVDSADIDAVYSFANPDTANYLNNALFKEGFQTSKFSEEADNTKIVIGVGVADIIQEKLREKFTDNPFKVLKVDLVGPKIGKELKTDAVIAVFLALLVILVYLGFRFKFVFAIGAVVALFHDVLITLGLFSLLYGVSDWLNLEISINVVAAFLTLVGYSINDTVVVYDRIRENLKIHKTGDLGKIINKSISDTMPRTIITSLTTLLSTFVLLLFGGDVLRGFAFTLFFGVIVGTYSSIFVASSFVYDYVTKSKKRISF